MSKLHVDLCGVPFKNPIIAASGCFAFGSEFKPYMNLNEIGGISLKALTAQRREGNPGPRIAETPSGILNAVGLQNPGIDAFLDRYLPELEALDTVLIANIAGAAIEEYCQVAGKLRGIEAVKLIELNISCPNVAHGGAALGTRPELVEQVVSAVKPCCDKPLIVKLSPNVTDIVEIALAAQEAGADALSLINTLTGMAVDLDRRRPVLGNVTGGLSGPAVKPIALRMLNQVRQAVRLPLIGMGGIMTGRDAAEFLLCGATCVMVGTANLVEPDACLRIARELDAFLEEKGIADVNDWINTLVR